METGFTVIDAANHDEALRLWQDHHDRISIVVTALNGTDGLTLAKAVESDCPEKPVILITDAETGFSHPTLRKPFELDDLLAVIRRAVDRK